MNDKLKILITFGSTREYIDPVRFISNASSGLMGFYLFKALVKKFVNVFAITGPLPGITIDQKYHKKIISAKDLYNEVKKNIRKYDIFISAAAVADYAPYSTSKKKIKSNKASLILKLRKNPDIISMVKKENKNIFSVGFSLETGNKSVLINNSIKKMESKNMDMVIANNESNLENRIKAVYVINKKGSYKYLKMDVEKITDNIAKMIIKEYEKYR